VFDEIGSADEPVGRLRVVISPSGWWPSAAAARHRGEQRAGRHDDPAAVGLASSMRSGRGNSARRTAPSPVCQPPASAGRCLDQRSRRAFDRESACLGTSRAPTTGSRSSAPSARCAPCRRCRWRCRRSDSPEGVPGEAARHRASDGAEAGDGNTGWVHPCSLREGRGMPARPPCR